MKRFLILFLSLILLVQLAFAADKAIVYDDTNKKIKTSDPLPIAQGGTGSATQNFVGLTGDQTVAGTKTFSTIPVLPASDPTTDNQASRKAFIDGKFNTSTGHDHDGTDSKKVLQTNIDTTGGTSGQVYKADGVGGGSWGTVNQLSNLIFSFGLSEVSNIYDGSSYLSYSWSTNYSPSLITFIRSKYRHLSGINTVTVYAYCYRHGSLGSSGTYRIQVDIGGQSNYVDYSGGDAKGWHSFSIDVSGLTPETVYDLLIQGKQQGTSYSEAYLDMYYVVGIAN